MKSFTSLALLGLVAATATAAPPAGSWRMTFDVGSGQSITFLLAFEEKGGTWSGKFLGATEQLPPTTAVEGVKVVGDRIQFNVNINGQELGFDGKLPVAAGGKALGSISLTAGGQMLLTALEPSQLAAFDRTGLLKEIAAQGQGILVYDAVAELMRGATAAKAPAEEVRAWAERAAKAAEPYGARWQVSVLLRTVRALSDQPDYAAIALAHAQRAERLLDPADDAAIQMPVLEQLAKLLTDAKKTDDAKEIVTRLAKLEERDYQEYQKKFPFQPIAFAGRKGKSDRAVLVELFTGAECPPCVAADLGFDGLGKSYPTTEVIRLEYHLHIPGPDPMTNPATEARQKFYGDAITGTPVIFFNGKPDTSGGGPEKAGVTKFKQYKTLIDPMLETPAGAKLTLSAKRDGGIVTLRSTVKDLAKPGPKMKLRLAIAEDVVRYKGGNGIRFHHCVVRGFAGGDQGFVLTQASTEHAAAVNLTELKTGLVGYLDKFQKENEEANFPDRPLGLKNLKVVAFVQDDATFEVLQAMQVEIK